MHSASLKSPKRTSLSPTSGNYILAPKDINGKLPADEKQHKGLKEEEVSLLTSNKL